MKTLRSLLPLCGFLLLALPVVPAQAQDDVRTIEDTVPLEADGRVAIDTYKGSITITTWDRDEVRYEARIEPDDDPDLVAETEIDVDRSDRSLRLTTNYDDVRETASRDGLWGMFGSGGSVSLPFVHYTLTLPRTATLDIEDYKSEIDVRDLQADLTLETYKGEIALEAIEGAVDLETYKGEGTLRDIDGDLVIDTYKGRLRVERLSGAVEVETYKGDVEVDIAAFTGDCEADTYKGEITFHVPADVGFDIDAELGDKADLDSDFPLDNMRHDDDDVRAEVNGGGYEIELDSYKGEIILRSR